MQVAWLATGTHPEVMIRLTGREQEDLAHAIRGRAGTRAAVKSEGGANAEAPEEAKTTGPATVCVVAHALSGNGLARSGKKQIPLADARDNLAICILEQDLVCRNILGLLGYGGLGPRGLAQLKAQHGSCEAKEHLACGEQESPGYCRPCIHGVACVHGASGAWGPVGMVCLG